MHLNGCFENRVEEIFCIMRENLLSHSVCGNDINASILSRDLEELGQTKLEAATARLNFKAILETGLELIDGKEDGGVLVGEARADLRDEVGTRGNKHGKVVCHLVESDQIFVVTAFVELLHKLKVHDLRLLKEYAEVELSSRVSGEVKHIEDQ